jgi:hypothetical protein
LREDPRFACDAGGGELGGRGHRRLLVFVGYLLYLGSLDANGDCDFAEPRGIAGGSATRVSCREGGGGLYAPP